MSAARPVNGDCGPAPSRLSADGRPVGRVPAGWNRRVPGGSGRRRSQAGRHVLGGACHSRLGLRARIAASSSLSCRLGSMPSSCAKACCTRRIGGQCFGLPTGAEQAQHQLTAESLV